MRKINYFDTPADKRAMGSAFPIYKWILGGADAPEVELSELDNTLPTEQERISNDRHEDWMGSYAD